MGSVPGRESGDTGPRMSNKLDTHQEGERLRPTKPNSPQHRATRRAGNVSIESLSSTGSKPSGQEWPPIREASPLRPQFTASARGTSRSRKNSQDLSPTRNAINSFSHPVPSAAAIQRALSANKPPPQASIPDLTSETRSPRFNETTSLPPTSPRLTSPPPSSALRSSTQTKRKSDSDMAAPNSSQKRLAASVSDSSTTAGKPNTEKEEPAPPRSANKAPARGLSSVTLTLETVAENGTPGPPSVGDPSERSTVGSPQEFIASQDDELRDGPRSKAAKGNGDGESDHGGAKVKVEAVAKSNNATGSKTTAGLPKKTFTNLGPTKSRVGEPPTRSMTVETETVSSVPQAPLTVAGDRGVSGKLDVNGGIRLKASNETMKPKRERKKNSRRPTSINTGTISSKADIFEAKVASAVDEANSSDSDETFVYESNPPEPYQSRSARHHSRTPSANSLASQADQYGPRNKSNAKDGQRSVAGKRSMKFANYNTSLDEEYGIQGAGRGISRIVSSPRHHHISRHSRGPSHVSLFDNESPFLPVNKPASPRVASGRTRPNSPRFFGHRATSSPRKAEGYAYDADEGVADDERMPLTGSVRVNRVRHAKKPDIGSLRQNGYIDDDVKGVSSGHGTSLMVGIVFLILCMGAGSFIMALSRPLMDVSIEEINNVLATEQELMLDLNVRATNPNLFAITVSELNVDVFVKSRFAGSAIEWREHHVGSSGWRERRTRRSIDQSSHLADALDGVDEGNGRIVDPESKRQIMVLGRIFELDSPLVFEASPIRRQPMLSSGEVRLTKPGNQTEDGGSARWERVIQHPFELIVGGSMKYQLPLSSLRRSASLRSKIYVDPKDAEGARPSQGR